ncbi:MAG TPA: hypothetical protein VMW72_13570 [Sedimentisphaerales bacterium]|nr:hypothetical protein [Sedimentisphaerales bacterium]
MVRILQTLSILALISTGIVFVLCVVQWLQNAPETDENPRLPIVEKFSLSGGRSEQSSQ